MTFSYKAYEVDIRRESSDEPPIQLNDTNELVAGLREYYDGLDREVVLSVILDDLNRLLGIYEVAKGGITEVALEFSNVLRPAILMGGRKVILVHNHPSGEEAPSEADMQMAKGLFLVASLLDMELSDNIVLGTQAWRSIHEEPEFVRWLSEDLIKISAVMSGGVLTQEQIAAAEQLKRVLSGEDAG
jgi:DNA repair protein RadC